jgi:hypothetical protein
MRPSAQWRCSPHNGGGSVWRGPTAETTQHVVGCCNPRGGVSGEACTWWRRSPWRRVAAAYCICVAHARRSGLGSGFRGWSWQFWVACHRRVRWSAAHLSSVGGWVGASISTERKLCPALAMAGNVDTLGADYLPEGVVVVNLCRSP